MRNKIIYFGLFFSALIFLASCKNQGKGNNGIGQDTLLAKTISFSDRLSILDDSQFKNINLLRPEIVNKKKIVSIIDGTCMSCVINQLNKVDSTFKTILTDDQSVMIFILNVNKADSSYFMLNLQPSIKAAGVILWDNNYNFERENKLFTSNSFLRTFMTNEKDKIVLVGNPVMNPDIISEYQAKLKE